MRPSPERTEAIGKAREEVRAYIASLPRSWDERILMGPTDLAFSALVNDPCEVVSDIVAEVATLLTAIADLQTSDGETMTPLGLTLYNASRRLDVAVRLASVVGQPTEGAK